MRREQTYVAMSGEDSAYAARIGYSRSFLREHRGATIKKVTPEEARRLLGNYCGSQDAERTKPSRSAQWMAALNEVENMSIEECRREVSRLADAGGFLGLVCATVLMHEVICQAVKFAAVENADG